MKKLAAILLIGALLFSLSPVSALAATSSDQSVQMVMALLGIMTGDENGNLNLNNAVTRAEFTKMLVCSSTQKDASPTANSSPFRDVPYTHWSASYIKTAVVNQWVTGYLDGTYRPDNSIKLEESVSAALKLLGYTASDFSGTFPDGQLALYNSLSLNDGVSCSRGQTMSRSDCMMLFYNLLTAKLKNSSQTLLQSLGYQTASDGSIDYAQLLSDSMSGPIIANASFLDQLSFPPKAYYRNGVSCTSSDINQYDVLYYSSGLRSVWAYSKKVTGTYQSAAPSADAPSSVTVAGTSYSISTAEAAFALSTMGSLSIGSSITLLLDKNGAIAGAMLAITLYEDIYGVLSSAETKTYTAADGSTYSAPSITVWATDGSEYSFQLDGSSYKIGALVCVSYATGSPKLSVLSSSSLSGTINASGKSLGSYTLANNLEILERAGSVYQTTYLSRLDGIQLQTGDVLFYSLNSKGEISKLILEDVTGDLYSYGILLEMTETNAQGSGLRGSYTFNISGKQQTLSTTTTLFHPTEGPCRFLISGNTLEDITVLSKVSLTALNQTYATSSEKAYLLADNIPVYLLQDETYYQSSLSLIADTAQYSLKGYYDKSETDGGRMRVIIATAKG